MRQTCKACGRPDKFNWAVPDGTWAAVVPEDLRGLVLCLSCFDGLATDRGVPYGLLLQDLVFVGDATTIFFEPVRVIEKARA